ncbi:MFS transporter [Microbispora bryophytorum]|uniref:Putative proline/betaine transporter n=1 Tax=Microbispora bryophytorum TaxID=1460882 RepID=A0A8H9LHQ1_9ACTN|nr:MFS transporter [Microbispora bryophytorum]MBD3136636.1 MHS family MFS transporter [Microbispora bryophytorum]TQS06226.1 MHS family MFS transporter [Microbispora bryophytorum]GGO17863.1 MFS transporter [Microbispora bryophytorum]
MANTPPARIGKVVGASLIGTTIEWYDFFLYGSAAALVFNKLFFPTEDELTGTLLAFLTYAVGFVARPLGGLVFGHYGDRLGRKRLLVVSLLMMGGATFLIGLLPTYATLGAGAPLLLTVLRLVQGFALGGEWGGAVLLVSEHGDPRHRGFWASWPQAGAPGGNLIATGVLALLAAVQPDDAFLAWGWRIAFLLSGVLVLIGLWIRLTVAESPLFQEALERQEPAPKAPIAGVLRHHWRDVLVAMGARMAENVSYYVITAFVLVYGTTAAGLPKGTVLNAVLIGSAFHFVTIPLWGALSDRIGRRPVYLLGAAGVGLWAFAFFPLIDTGNFALVTVAVTVGLLLHGAMYGPQAAFFSELFATRMRYSGVSIGYQLASIAAGGVAPLIAVALLDAYGSSVPISVYVVAAAILTVIAVIASRETRDRDLSAIEPTSGATRAAAIVKEA